MRIQNVKRLGFIKGYGSFLALTLGALAISICVGGCDESTTGDPDTIQTDVADGGNDQTSADVPSGDLSPQDTASDLTDDTQDTDSTALDTVADLAEVTDTRPDVGPTDDLVPASEYCERTAEMFCTYYLRCERLALPAETQDPMTTCLARFAEGCEHEYEPIYAAHAARGELALSASGIDTCQAHLETVACATQIFDLDGPCAAMWQGQQAHEGTCGPGIGSFVCGEGSACVLGLDFCGQCRVTAEADAACGADIATCEAQHSCIDGTCRPRIPVGSSCDPDVPCVLGARCVDDVCAGPEIVAVDEACDGQTRRCQYNAICLSGTCALAAQLGESCVRGQCTSGTECTNGTCTLIENAGSNLMCFE